jgi:hypothetical protein
MFKNMSWRVFLAGMLCGTVLTVAVGAPLVWWKFTNTWWSYEEVMRAQDDDTYDRCLIAQAGNKVACDALMRVLGRYSAAEIAMKKEAARMLAAGHTKREVIEWGYKHGFSGQQMSEAVGISWRDLIDKKY